MTVPIGLPDPLIIHATIASDQLGESLPWPLQKYDIPAAWARSRGAGVRVGVLDSGVDSKHCLDGDLKGAVKSAKDFTGSRLGWQSGHPHGSHVAGIIGARHGNKIGISGVAPECDLVVAKGLDDQGIGDDENIARAIVWLVDEGCNVINFSGGGPFVSQLMQKAIDYAISKGCLFVVAAGNSGTTEDPAIAFPARLGSCIAVTAVDEDGELANFSSRGHEADVGCPGTRVLSCGNSGTYMVMSGTSQAAPFFTGVVALAMSAGRKFSGTADDCRDWLRTITKDAGIAGDDPFFGIGVVDVQKLLSSGKPEPPKVEGPVDEQVVKVWNTEFVFHKPAIAGDDYSFKIRR